MSEDQLTENEELAEEAPDQASAESGAEPEEAPLTLEEQLAQAQAKADEYLDGWQRARAELANFKKRVERERAEMYDAARVAVLARFLDTLDDLERALAAVPEKLDGGGWLEGLLHIERKFRGVLESEGVTEIEAVGQFFDPVLHEAISQEASENHEDGQIIDVVQKGYMLGDKIVRPARVRVAG